jgi:hypothetical protein
MAGKSTVPLLVPFARENLTLEASKAAAMFDRFVSGHFSYDEISNQPDYLVYMSAEVLAITLPPIIDEMLARRDTGNFLIYPLITAVDPSGGGRAHFAERTAQLAELAGKETTEKIVKLLYAIRDEPPNSVGQVDRLVAFWQPKASFAAIGLRSEPS